MRLLTIRQRQSCLIGLLKLIGLILVSPFILVISPFVIWHQWHTKREHQKRVAI